MTNEATQPSQHQAPHRPNPNVSPELLQRRPIARRYLAGLVAILLLAIVVRFHDITRHSLWLDEFFSLQHSAGRGGDRLSVATSGVRTPPPDLIGRLDRAPYPRIWQGMANADVHPPLYQVLLRAWRDALNPLFGDGDAMIRALSAVLSVAAVALLWDVVRLLHGPAPALWAALIMALASPQIHWAQDARPYTLLLLFSLGAIDAVVRLERLGPGRLRTTILALCTLCVGLTHYYGLPALFALGCYAAVRLRRRARMQAGAAMLGGVVLFALVWGTSLLNQLRGAESQSAYLLDNSPGHLGRTLMRAALLPARSLNEVSPRVATVACLGAIVFVLPLLLRRRRPDLMLWAWWMIGAVAPALMLDLAKGWEQLDYLRYSSLVMPGVYALIAAVVGGTHLKRPWLAHVVPAAAALSCAIALPQAYAETQTPKPDYPWLAENIAKHASDGDALVYFNPNDPGSPLLWYMAMSWYTPAEAMPKTVVFLMGPPDEHARRVLAEAPVVWTVVERGHVLPDLIIAPRVPGEVATGFNLPVLQRWMNPAPATLQPTTRPR